MTAPVPPTPSTALRVSRHTIELDGHTALTEGIFADGIGFLRIGTAASFADVMFRDATSLERVLEALQALHRRYADRQTGSTPRSLRAVPRD